MEGMHSLECNGAGRAPIAQVHEGGFIHGQQPERIR